VRDKSLKLPPLFYDPPQDPLRVLYQDDDILVLSKPSGILSVPGKAEDQRDCLETRAQLAIPNALLTHRLDLETSGVFMMALNKPAQAHINRQFEKRRTQKHYIARVWGHVEGENGRVDLPMCNDWENRPRQMICHEHGRAAQTDWDVIERGKLPCGNGFTRLLLEPITGRTHQLRVHMEELGHPILGEVFYAHDDAENAAERLQLHAESLTIHHPKDETLITFTDSTPF
jgi:tRNA pseudouridine32 synthase/23S rRNA pseudouridine746 synthase